MKKVYIASPYTKGDIAVNVRTQMEMADKLMDYGICPIVPLLVHFQHMLFPRQYEDWMKIGFAKIEGCDALLRLPGESEGADREVEYAESIGVKVHYNIVSLLAEFSND